MRDAVRRSRRRRKGCLSGVFKFLIFIAVLAAAVLFVGRLDWGGDVATKIRKTQYPVKYSHFVEKYSHEFGLDKYLVYAVIRTESRFDKYAVSSADAKGLMQLTDETGTECAKRLRLENYSSAALFDPEINIRLGCSYLRRLIDTYGGKTEVALAAYNGGPGNVDKWLEDDNFSDRNGNLINIPFEETKNYVTRVMDSFGMYREIYMNE